MGHTKVSRSRGVRPLRVCFFARFIPDHRLCTSAAVYCRVLVTSKSLDGLPLENRKPDLGLAHFQLLLFFHILLYVQVFCPHFGTAVLKRFLSTNNCEKQAPFVFRTCIRMISVIMRAQGVCGRCRPLNEASPMPSYRGTVPCSSPTSAVVPVSSTTAVRSM